jgi:uncharacterized protein with GYD domain
MAKYVVLINFTDQGIRTITESVRRARNTSGTFERFGVKRLQQYWTMGSHDLVTVMEAPDDETMMRAMLAVGQLGNVRTNTLKAYDATEMEKVIQGL